MSGYMSGGTSKFEGGIGGLQVRYCGLFVRVGGVDVILRVDWLRTLGEVRVDWGRMRIIVLKEGQEKVLQGDTALQRSLVSLHFTSFSRKNI